MTCSPKKSVRKTLTKTGDRKLICPARARSRLGRAFHDPSGEIDIDIFCIWQAAPLVRLRLIERCGLMCGGVDNEEYAPIGRERDHMGDRAFSKLYHVECYAGRPTKGYYFCCHTMTRIPYTSDEYYQNALACGEEMLELEWVENGELYGSMIGMPGGSAGGEFPLDYNLLSRRGSGYFVRLI